MKMKGPGTLFIAAILVVGFISGGALWNRSITYSPSPITDSEAFKQEAYHLRSIASRVHAIPINTAPAASASKTLRDVEPTEAAVIRQMMENYFTINELAAKYMEEKGYWKEDLTPEEIDVQGLYPRVSGLVTRSWLEKLDELMVRLNETSGEGMGPPNLGLRMDILENTPTRIRIRTAKLPDDFGAGYTAFGIHYYMTALNVKGKWLIDDVLEVPARNEPLNLSWEEAKMHLQEMGIEVKYAGTAEMDGPIMFADAGKYVTIPMKVYLVDHPGIKAISAVTGRVILKNE
jgi:hypothetical protein